MKSAKQPLAPSFTLSAMRSYAAMHGYDISVATHNGRVWIELDGRTETTCQDLTPVQARELGAALMAYADEADDKEF